MKVRKVTERKKPEQEVEELIMELRKRLSGSETPRGILPICSYCKRIRNEKGYWDQIELCIAQHSMTTFSHSICPECLDKHYPELNNKK